MCNLLEIVPDRKPNVLFEAKPKKIVGFVALAATDGNEANDRMNLSLERSKSVSFKPIENEPVDDDKPTSYLKERGVVRQLVSSGQVSEAREYIQMTLPTLYRQSEKLQAYLDVLEFLSLIKSGETVQATKFSESALSRFAKCNRTRKQGYINIPVYSKSEERIILRPLDYLNGLLCYADPVEQTKGASIGSLLKPQQTLLLIDMINNLILAGKSNQLAITNSGFLESKKDGKGKIEGTSETSSTELERMFK